MKAGRRREVAVVGAGIVGAAVAWELAKRGARVTVYEVGELGGGATAEGMGHLLFLADSPQQFELIGRSMELWGELLPELPHGSEVDRCGTLWLAADEDDLAIAREKVEGLAGFGVDATLVGPRELQRIEPALSPHLLGAMRVPGDAVVYPPRIVSYLLTESAAASRIQVHAHMQVEAIEDGADSGRGRPRLRVRTGQWTEYEHVIVASGVGTGRLLPEVGILPRKGHLAITDRYPGFLRHQVVELAYVRNTHMGEGDSISMNVQPRSTGQVLIGSCRQFAGLDRSVDPAILGRMIGKARRYIPSIDSLQILRVWTGFRPASPDGRPWIGALPRRPGLWIASGHEGLGITSAMATAELLADLLFRQVPHVSPDLYSPNGRIGVAAGSREV